MRVEQRHRNPVDEPHEQPDDGDDGQPADGEQGGHSTHESRLDRDAGRDGELVLGFR